MIKIGHGFAQRRLGYDPRSVVIEPGAKLVQHGFAVRLARQQPISPRLVRQALDAVELGDELDGLVGQPALAFDLNLAGFDKASSGVHPANQVFDAPTCYDGVIAAVAVRHQIPRPTGEQLLRHGTAAAGLVVKQCDRFARRAATLDPHIAFGRRQPPRFFEHLNRRFIHMDQWRAQQRVARQVEQRLKRLGRADHPARHGLPRQAHTSPGHDMFQASQGQPVDVLGRDQASDGAVAGVTLGENLRSSRSGQRSVIAAGAGVALANMAQHPDLHRHDVQLFADVSADLHHRRAARAKPLRFGDFMDDIDAGQLGRQRQALAARGLAGRLGRFAGGRSISADIVSGKLGGIPRCVVACGVSASSQDIRLIEQAGLRRAGLTAGAEQAPARQGDLLIDALDLPVELGGHLRGERLCEFFCDLRRYFRSNFIRYL